MSVKQPGDARAVADIAEGLVIATVEIPSPSERVFRALASKEIVDWWIRPGVFDTREWAGDVRVGGTWQSSGLGGGKPYVLEGKFVEVDEPRKLVHTWHLRGTPGAPTTVTYLVEQRRGVTRVTLRHAGFTSPDGCVNTAMGWETSFTRLAEIFAPMLVANSA